MEHEFIFKFLNHDIRKRKKDALFYSFILLLYLKCIDPSILLAQSITDMMGLGSSDFVIICAINIYMRVVFKKKSFSC